MKNPQWGPGEQAEYDAAIHEVFTRSKDIRERTAHFETIIADGVNAHRAWARDIERQATWHGLQKILKAEESRVRQIETPNATRSGTVGVKVHSAERVMQMRLPWEELTWDGLAAKCAEYAKQLTAYNQNLAICAALMDLRERAGTAATVGEALVCLGVDLQGYLDSYFRAEAS